ncbi:hypothetical protein ACIGEP_16365 [Microbacterium sp. NPDC077663]|uniref:hypothetical protein n=1 Tax=Microbacterium sp. NPDC077663 TaxID=3364189 RepID=UPI0037CCBF5B
MPFRSKQTLENWLTDFRNANVAGDHIRVILQDGSDGADTGLVIMQLGSAAASLYMQPVEIGEAKRRVTIVPALNDTDLSSEQLHTLSAELSVAARLCTYLEARSIGREEDAEETSDPEAASDAKSLTVAAVPPDTQRNRLSLRELLDLISQ